MDFSSHNLPRAPYINVLYHIFAICQIIFKRYLVWCVLNCVLAATIVTLRIVAFIADLAELLYHVCVAKIHFTLHNMNALLETNQNYLVLQSYLIKLARIGIKVMCSKFNVFNICYRYANERINPHLQELEIYVETITLF